VAWLNPGMWTELFLENRDNLIREIDTLIGRDEDEEALETLDALGFQQISLDLNE
jgi:prephenate dehydrogenase